MTIALGLIVGLLQAALALLALVQQNPLFPQAQRDQAVQVAQQAITQATNALQKAPIENQISPANANPSKTKSCNGIGTRDSNCLTGTPISGSAPLTVTFTTESTPSGAYLIDFSDGSKSGQLMPRSCTNSSPASCIYSITHTYQNVGVYNAILVGPQAVAGYLWITVGGETATPQLASISPTLLSVGTQATLTGSGFLAEGDTIIVDGHYIVGGNANPTSDITQTFSLPQYVSDKDACLGFQGSCEPTLTRLPAGQHTVVLQNVNGTSNSLPFTSTN